LTHFIDVINIYDITLCGFLNTYDILIQIFVFNVR